MDDQLPELAVTILKKCPFCGEEIIEDAIKCKHCKEFLDSRKSAVSPPKQTDIKTEPVKGVATGTLVGCSMSSVLMMIFVLVGIFLCGTGLGALIGIPLILGAIMFPFVGAFAGLGSAKGECPWCGTVNSFSSFSQG